MGQSAIFRGRRSDGLFFLIAPWCLIVARIWFLVALEPATDAPIHSVEYLFWAFMLAAGGFAGAYSLTLSITVGEGRIVVASLGRTRSVSLTDIGSVESALRTFRGANYRVLTVKTRSGKNILSVTKPYLPGYDDLVDLLRAAVQANSSC